MADVKWIKLTVDMFDNRKIKHLRRLPDGNNIVLIWVMLLTMAGRCNASGMIFLTENIPYTPKMLADELGFEENTVILALNALEQFNMIVRDEGFFTISGWDEYQNIEGMERIKEQNRLRKQRQREKEKLIVCANQQMSRDSHALSRDSHAIDIEEDIEIEKEIEKEKEIVEEEKPKRKRFVPPTLEEVRAYCLERKNNVDPQKFYDYFSASDWFDSKGNKVKNWKQKVITWEGFSNKKTVGANGIPISNAPSDLDEIF